MRYFTSWSVALALLWTVGGGDKGAAAAEPSTAFFYSSNVPAEALAQFDRVVVQADQASDAAVDLLRRRGSKVFAYVSLSEVSRPTAAKLEPKWRLGENPDWRSVIMDTTQPAFRSWLIEQSFKPLWDRGYRAFFLDNLDSYQRPLQNKAARAAQVHGLLAIIQELYIRFPGVQLLLNRGFELLPEAGTSVPLAAGMVVESLFRSWNPATRKYVEVSAEERKSLLVELRTARDKYRLPITVIDYVDPSQPELARATAKRIAALDMTPFVGNADLSTLGMGSVEVVPRRVLALYNGAEQRDRGPFIDVAYTPVHTMAAMALEYLGYAVDYHDVRDPLPTGPLVDRYAGIVTWFTDDKIPPSTGYRGWLLQQIDAGMKVAVLDHLGFLPDEALQKKLGFTRSPGSPLASVQLHTADPEAVGFEAAARPRQNIFYPLQLTDTRARALLSVKERRGARMDAVFTTWWGGMAVAPYLLADGYDHSYRWIVNPFTFFKRALQLPDMPAPDVTTVDGRRMLMVHIDGDGFPSRAEMPGNDFCSKNVGERSSATERGVAARGRTRKRTTMGAPDHRGVFCSGLCPHCTLTGAAPPLYSARSETCRA